MRAVVAAEGGGGCGSGFGGFLPGSGGFFLSGMGPGGLLGIIGTWGKKRRREEREGRERERVCEFVSGEGEEKRDRERRGRKMKIAVHDLTTKMIICLTHFCTYM